MSVPISEDQEDQNVVTDDLLDKFRNAWMQSMQSDPRTDDPERIADRAGLTAVLAAVRPNIEGPWRTAQAIDSEIIASSRRLLEYALHLRMSGENAPGGNETWAQFDRDCEHFLRTTRPEPAATEGGAQ